MIAILENANSAAIAEFIQDETGERLLFTTHDEAYYWLGRHAKRGVAYQVKPPRPCSWHRDTRQREILTWACTTFGTQTADNLGERLRRFAEEAVELVQSAGLEEQAMLDLVKYVYARPAGDTAKEIGQVGVALLGLAEHLNISADHEEQKEFTRIRSMPAEHWQARQNAKADKGIALPVTPEESCASFG